MKLMRLVVTYTCDNRTLSVQDINNLLVFDRQILKKKFGPVQCKEGWRIRRINELRKLVKGANIVKYVNSTRNRMVGWGGIITEWKI
jgi:hypothetical protein